MRQAKTPDGQVFNVFKTQSRDTAVSLESWHDTVHGIIGTGDGYSGHMGNPGIAAVRRSILMKVLWNTNSMFSLTQSSGYIIGKVSPPIFISAEIVDSNIDRLFAIYQALYPDKWIPKLKQEVEDDWGSIIGGKDQTADASLYPFRHQNQNAPQRYWTSNDVRDWTTLGFATPGSKLLDSKGMHDLQKYLNNTYSWYGLLLLSEILRIACF